MTATIAVLGMFGGVVVAGLGIGLLALLVMPPRGGSADDCGSGPAARAPARSRSVRPDRDGSSARPSTAARAIRSAAPSARPASTCSTHPDSYAELGGLTFQTATAMGGLPYMTPLRITWGRRSVIAYKRDFGLGGGPIDGLPRVIDLWWELAERLGIPLATAAGRARSGSPARRMPAPATARRPARPAGGGARADHRPTRRR